MITWASPSPQPYGITIGSAVFAQMTAECPYTLQWAAPSLSKLHLPMGGSGSHLYNTWFPGSIRVLSPNGIWIGSALFTGLTSVTDRQTDRPRYSVGNNRPHLRTYLLRCGLLMMSRPILRSQTNFPRIPTYSCYYPTL